jgi:uncharacterized membrane protein YbhN (UPF0104 family)
VNEVDASNPEAAVEEERRERSPLFKALRAAAWVAVLVALVVLGRRLDWPRVRTAFGEADLRFALVALAVWPISAAFQGLRWGFLAREAMPIRIRDALSAFYVGAAATALLPLRAGEAVRLELLARAGNSSRAVSLGTVALDHTVNGVVMFLFALALPLLLPVPRWVLVVVFGGMLAVIALVLVLLKLAKSPPRPGVRGGGLRGMIDRLRGGLAGLHNPKAVLLAAAAATLAWALEIAHASLALATFHLPHGPAHAMAVLFGVNLFLALPAPPANLGNFEVGAGVSMVALGGNAEAAAAFALGFHALQLLPTLLTGAIFLPIAGKGRAPPPTAASPSRAA